MRIVEPHCFLISYLLPAQQSPSQEGDVANLFTLGKLELLWDVDTHRSSTFYMIDWLSILMYLVLFHSHKGGTLSYIWLCTLQYSKFLMTYVHNAPFSMFSILFNRLFQWRRHQLNNTCQTSASISKSIWTKPDQQCSCNA